MDYSNACIYKIVNIDNCDDADNKDFYIGSCKHFKNRRYSHKSACNNIKSKEHNQNIYRYIRQNGGWNQWNMILLEEYPCNSKYELEQRERELIEEMKPNINKNIPTRNRKERYLVNREKLKQLYLNNRERLKQKYIDNRQKKIEYQKQYNLINRERILQKVACDNCGCRVVKSHLERHKQTNKCINFKPE